MGPARGGGARGRGGGARSERPRPIGAVRRRSGGAGGGRPGLRRGPARPGRPAGARARAGRPEHDRRADRCGPAPGPGRRLPGGRPRNRGEAFLCGGDGDRRGAAGAGPVESSRRARPRCSPAASAWWLQALAEPDPPVASAPAETPAEPTEAPTEPAWPASARAADRVRSSRPSPSPNPSPSATPVGATTKADGARIRTSGTTTTADARVADHPIRYRPSNRTHHPRTSCHPLNGPLSSSSPTASSASWSAGSSRATRSAASRSSA